MQTLQLSETTAAQRRIPVYLVDATDGFTPEVGVVTPTIEVSKNGAAQVAGGGTWTEIGEGLYYYQATAGEIDTLGFLNVRIVKAAVSREFQAVVQVVSWDPYFDFTTPLDATVSSRASAVALTAVQADTDDIQSRLPAALVGGAMNSDVSNMQTDTLDADALAADAVTEIQSGLGTAVAIAAVQADTDDIQTRLPVALVGGAMNSDVSAMQTDTLNAAALATDAVSEIQAGLATAAGLAGVGIDVSDIQSRLPLALVGGRMDSDVGNIQASVLDDIRIAIMTYVVNGNILGLTTEATLDMTRKILNNRLALADGGSGDGNWVLYDDDNTPFLTYDVTDKDGSDIAQTGFVPARRTRGV